MTLGPLMLDIEGPELTAEDREAIAAYLKSLPPKPSRWKKEGLPRRRQFAQMAMQSDRTGNGGRLAVADRGP